MAPQRRLAGELPPLLLPRGISVQGEDQLADLAHPLSAPALHAEDGHLWALRMMSESSNTPFLRCACAFASHREPHGVADAMIDAVVADLLCQPFNPVW